MLHLRIAAQARPADDQIATSTHIAPRQSGIFLTAFARDVLREPPVTPVNLWAVVFALLAGFGFAVGVGSLLLR